MSAALCVCCCWLFVFGLDNTDLIDIVFGLDNTDLIDENLLFDLLLLFGTILFIYLGCV